MSTKMIQTVCAVCMFVLIVFFHARLEFEANAAVNSLFAKALPTQTDSSRYSAMAVELRGVSQSQARALSKSTDSSASLSRPRATDTSRSPDSRRASP
jgi:hypothetical protein